MSIVEILGVASIIPMSLVGDMSQLEKDTFILNIHFKWNKHLETRFVFLIGCVSTNVIYT